MLGRFLVKKIFSYIIVLLVWSVGVVYTPATASVDDKPDAMSCMDWLQDLETRRDLAAQRVIDDPHEQNLADLTQKIVATIAGKYGISSTPATPQEREKILRSIDKNRQLSPTMPNMMAEYLGYEEDSTLSEDQLRRIAQEKGIDFQVFQGHLAAIAVADGAIFSLKVPWSKRPLNC